MTFVQMSYLLSLLALAFPCIGLLGLFALLPIPYPDRLASIPPAGSRIDNVSPYDSVDKWGPDGRQAGLHRLNPARVNYFDEQVRKVLQPPFRVLDVGCGGGLVSNALAQREGYEIQGVDLSAPALQYAESIATKAALHNVKFSSASVYELPFDNASFDVVLMSDVLEHLLELPRALTEAARVLRPGGIFLFDTIDRSVMSYLISIIGAERIVGLIQPGSHDWRLFVRPEELQQGLIDAGFRDMQYAAFDPSMRALVELTMFGFGLLRSTQMSGGWMIGEQTVLTTSYIGIAVRTSQDDGGDATCAAGSDCVR